MSTISSINIVDGVRDVRAQFPPRSFELQAGQHRMQALYDYYSEIWDHDPRPEFSTKTEYIISRVWWNALVFARDINVYTMLRLRENTVLDIEADRDGAIWYRLLWARRAALDDPTLDFQDFSAQLLTRSERRQFGSSDSRSLTQAWRSRYRWCISALIIYPGMGDRFYHSAVKDCLPNRASFFWYPVFTKYAVFLQKISCGKPSVLDTLTLDALEQIGVPRGIDSVQGLMRQPDIFASLTDQEKSKVTDILLSQEYMYFEVPSWENIRKTSAGKKTSLGNIVEKVSAHIASWLDPNSVLGKSKKHKPSWELYFSTALNVQLPIYHPDMMANDYPYEIQNLESKTWYSTNLQPFLGTLIQLCNGSAMLFPAATLIPPSIAPKKGGYSDKATNEYQQRFRNRAWQGVLKLVLETFGKEKLVHPLMQNVDQTLELVLNLEDSSDRLTVTCVSAVTSKVKDIDPAFNSIAAKEKLQILIKSWIDDCRTGEITNSQAQNSQDVGGKRKLHGTEIVVPRLEKIRKTNKSQKNMIVPDLPKTTQEVNLENLDKGTWCETAINSRVSVPSNSEGTIDDTTREQSANSQEMFDGLQGQQVERLSSHSSRTAVITPPPESSRKVNSINEPKVTLTRGSSSSRNKNTMLQTDTNTVKSKRSNDIDTASAKAVPRRHKAFVPREKKQ
ncbi:hypothetical protein EDC01DRAFT_626138 [Geopyxis carbonaria]|nr:hypothetical protein EDC01DRAFT_626138 [Geopyxis carbonaria]